jgi:uncharacterized protein YndB with AHSA1/START domain
VIDITKQLGAIHREVSRRQGADGEEVVVVVRRTYDGPMADVWDGLTDPERMKRWFYPVSGDLRVGGKFQLEGNAGGEILRCEPPRLLQVTFGGPTSLVELRLSPEGEDRTVLELEHTVPIEIAMNGAGSLFVGPGWDDAFVALDLYVHGVFPDDPIAAASSPERQELAEQSVHAWVAVVEASGTATSDEIATIAEMSLSHFAPDPSTTPHADRESSQPSA